MKEFNQNQIQEVADAFKNHQILAFPTDTVYGVGVKFGNEEDLIRLKNAKNRLETKPIPVMCSSIEQVETLAYINKDTKKIMEAFLPGALTLILPIKDINPAFTNGKDTIAIRIPDDSFVLQVIEKVGSPLFVTSANQSGNPTSLSYEQAKNELPNIDGIVYGTCRALQASTILDCTGQIRILREGPITLDMIRGVL